mgnify:FL=1
MKLHLGFALIALGLGMASIACHATSRREGGKFLTLPDKMVLLGFTSAIVGILSIMTHLFFWVEVRELPTGTYTVTIPGDYPTRTLEVYDVISPRVPIRAFIPKEIVPSSPGYESEVVTFSKRDLRLDL